MSRNFEAVRSADQRLRILRLLVNSPSGQANEDVIKLGLSMQGHDLTRARLKSELNWLSESQLVEIEPLSEEVSVIHLLEAGEDVAVGRVTVTGVKRPSRRR